MRPNMLMCFPTARLRGRGTQVDDTQPEPCCPNQEGELAWLQGSLWPQHTHTHTLTHTHSITWCWLSTEVRSSTGSGDAATTR